MILYIVGVSQLEYLLEYQQIPLYEGSHHSNRCYKIMAKYNQLQNPDFQHPNIPYWTEVSWDCIDQMTLPEGDAADIYLYSLPSVGSTSKPWYSNVIVDVPKQGLKKGKDKQCIYLSLNYHATF